MKKILSGLLYLVLVIVLAVMGSTFGIIGGILGALAGIAVIIVVKRAIVLYAIGQFKYNAGDSAEAYKWMKRAFNTTKLAPSLSLLYAYMMIRDGMLDEAEAVINKVTYLGARELTDTDLMNAKLNKSIIQWKKGSLGEAIDTLEEAYEDGLKSTTLYGTLGYFYILDNRYQKALEFNKEAYEYNSDNTVILDNLGASYIASTEFENADEIYSKLFEKKPEFIEPYYNYGTLMVKRGRYDIAKTYFEKALEYPEKYLSTITHDQIKQAIDSMGVYTDGENSEE